MNDPGLISGLFIHLLGDALRRAFALRPLCGQRCGFPLRLRRRLWRPADRKPHSTLSTRLSCSHASGQCHEFWLIVGQEYLFICKTWNYRTPPPSSILYRTGADMVSTPVLKFVVHAEQVTVLVNPLW